MRNDLLGSEEVFVRITLCIENEMEKVWEYLNCYAFHNVKLNQIEVRMPSDPPNMIPRATFPMSLNPIVEHYGPHRVPEVPQKPAQRRGGLVLDDEALRQRLAAQQAQAAPAGTTAQKQEAAMKAFEQDATPAEEQPSEKKFLEEAGPKSEAGSSTTDPEPTSVLPMVVTPSGRFAISPPPEDEAETSRLGMTGTSQPLRTGKGKLHKHARPKQLPGAALLVAVVLFLSLSFRHTS